MSNEYLDWRNDKLETYENLIRKIAIHAFSQKELINLIDNHKSWNSLNCDEKKMFKQLSLYNEYVLQLLEECGDDIKEYINEFEDIKKELKKIDVEYRVIDLKYSEIGNAIFSIVYKKNLNIHGLNTILDMYYNAVIYRYYYNVPYDIIVKLSQFLGVSEDFLTRHSFDPDKYSIFKKKETFDMNKVVYEDVIEEKMAKDRISYHEREGKTVLSDT